MDNLAQRPDWLKVRLKTGASFNRIKELNQRLNLRTVCYDAACPNIGMCWPRLELTYMLLGKNCTRTCRFCNITKANVAMPDPDEPERIAKAIEELGLDYVVLTSVTRDDLEDNGLSHFLKTVSLIKGLNSNVKVELLIPDFGKPHHRLKNLSRSGVEIIGHNIETVRELYPRLRPLSDYDSSLSLLNDLKSYNSKLITKSALMVGLGEDEAQVLKTMRDLKRCSVDILYLGQYLSPTKEHFIIQKIYGPEEFTKLKAMAQSLGFKVVVSAPLARSSWKAKQAYEQAAVL